MLIDILNFILYYAAHFYISVLFLRFLMQLFRADFHNPMAQLVLKLTTPVLKYPRRIIPGWKGMDISSIIISFIIMLLYLAFKYYIARDIAGLPQSFELSSIKFIASAVIQLIYHFHIIYIFALILQAIISWTQTGAYNPVSSILHSITSPFLNPIRKKLPQDTGIDFSPLILTIVIFIILKILTNIHVRLIGFPF